MKRDNRIYLDHILECTKRISQYMAGKTKEEFLADSLTQDAVTRQLEIIGEATKKISMELRNANSDIPWSDMAGMRDVIIHEYFDVDFDIVYDTVTQRVPELQVKVEQLLNKL